MLLPALLSRRKADSHKGDYGHVLVVAGSPRYSGAAVLCAEAAMRSGAALVTLAVPSGLNASIIKIKPKEVMTLPLPQTSGGSFSSTAFRTISASLNFDVLALGPGIAPNPSAYALVRKLLASVQKPAVIDAGGLDAIRDDLELLRNREGVETLITPHPGEMARLLGIKTSEIQKNRKYIAKKFAREYNSTVILKGHGTVVADPGGNIYINNTGNPGMATAGSGDVLAGIIAAFLGQGLKAFDAAKYGVYIHGLAGDLAAEEKTQLSLIASDIIQKLPEAFKKTSS